MSYIRPYSPLTSVLTRDLKLSYADDVTVPGFKVNGYSGPFTVSVLGAMKAVVPTTGVASGAAGVGTTTTSVVKPTGAANWTAGNLVGKLVKFPVTNGSPSDVPICRVIMANTTTTLTIGALSGVAAGAAFEIVEPATEVTLPSTPAPKYGLEITDNTARAVVSGFRFTSAAVASAIYARRNSSVKFVNCVFAGATTDSSVNCDENFAVTLEDCVFLTATSAAIDHSNRVSMNRCYQDTSFGLLVDNSHTVQAVDNVSVDCAGYAMYLRGINSATIGLSASDGAASALVLEAVNYSTLSGSITGTGNVGYGLEVSKGGTHALNGATITGTLGDFSVDGLSHASVTWAASASYGAVSRWGTTILVSGSSNIRQELDTLRVEGNFDVPASALVSGTGGTLQLGGRQINYGLFHLDQDDGITAFAGGGQASATALGFGANVVTVCATNGDSVKLTSAAAIGGTLVFVKNLGAASCNVFPPVGGAINALADDTAFAVAAGSSATFISRNNGSGGLDWVTQ